MLNHFKYIQGVPVALTIMARQKVGTIFKQLTRPLVQRLLLLALSTLVAMCLGTSLLFSVLHPLTPALSTVESVLLVSGETHAWGPTLTLWTGGLI